IEYGGLQPIFSHEGLKDIEELKTQNVLLLSGIASPEQLTHDLSPHCGHINTLTFGDHHRFRKKDVQLINKTFAAMEAPKCIVTTEKDATRLQGIKGLSDDVCNSIYALPITIRFMQEQEENFNNYIIDYVRKNSRNSILAKAKDDHQSKNRHRSGNRPRTFSFRNN
ncbi:MAG: tetraacyldisaccharide 4'-kinase, partial [Prevotella sp.]|nr:tetraacyldisaccharide 4'-kinase [Prevotella sp.]